MQRNLKFNLAVIAAVVLIDVVGSIASRAFHFNYTRLFWVSWCVYFLAGFVGYRRFGFLAGVVAGWVAGFAEATLGWLLSTAVGPYLPNRPQQPYGVLIVIVTVIIVSILGVFFGLIGALVSKLLSRGRLSTENP